MNGAVVISIHKIVDDTLVSTIKDENHSNPGTGMRSVKEELKFDYKNYDESKVCLNFNDGFLHSHITVQEVPNESSACWVKLNFPTLIKCQNCETNFPTKYQYQRHQCEFNSDKVTFKSELKNLSSKAEESLEKAVHECPVCYKIFISKANLEKHQACHSNNEEHICEYCGKHFVSENRLCIHKENHCKKAGDISKFYRSDVKVWKCRKCHEVFSSLNNANHHAVMCQEIEENGIFSQKEDEFNEYFEESVGKPNESVETISTEILLQCEFCNRTFSDKNLLLMHQRKHTTAKNYECSTCNRAFDSYSLAASHWLKKCSEYSNVFYLPKLSFCEYCDRTFKSHEILYNHKIKKKHYTPKLHLAVNIEKDEASSHSFENKDIINKLVQDVLKTLEVPMMECEAPIIKTETNSSSPGANKKRKWHKTAPQSKKHCTKTDEGFKYQCERCVKVFNCIRSLDAHRTGDHVATFCCEECGQTLASAKALLIHCRAHKSLKPYVCDTCGRSYSQTSHLWQHMRFHQGIKPFACPHEGCEARYTIRPDLKDHIRKVHTRERPFKCNVCNKCFLTGSVYYQHRLIHTNDRRYGCEICKKRFFRADALNNHKRIHTNERPYPCGVCGREFRQKGDRNKHVRTQHPEQFASVL